MGGMEDLLMGGDSSSSDDSDAEDKVATTAAAATQAMAMPLATIKTTAPPPPPTIMVNKPPVVSTASAVPKPATIGLNDSKSALTNRLKGLYASPPIVAAPVPPKQNVGVGVVPAKVGVGGVGIQIQQQLPPRQQHPPTGGMPAATLRRGSSGVPTPLPLARNVAPPPPTASTATVVSNSSSRVAAPAYVPPMVHTNHHGQPVQQQQRQQQQQPHQPGAVPQPVQSVGRVPAPLPKARTNTRSAPPSNRVASVPIPSRSSNASSVAPIVNMPPSASVPPPSPLQTTQQQQQQQQQQQGNISSSRKQQYAHAPHLQRGSGGGVSHQRQQSIRPSSYTSSSSQQQQQQHQHRQQPIQPIQQPSPSSRPTPESASPQQRSSAGSSQHPLTDQEKKEKERFLMFTRVLMKYLEQRDKEMHAQAKAQIKECYEKNKSGDPNFHSLTSSMKARLRATVGEGYWKKAHDYLDHFLKQKREQKEKQQQQQHQQAGSMPPQTSSSMQHGVPPPIVRTSAPRPSHNNSSSVQQHHEQQQQHLRTQSQAAAAAAKKMPIPTTSKPPSTILVAVVPTAATAQPVTKEEQQAARKEQRNENARKKRAARKKEKDHPVSAKPKVAVASVTGLPTGVGISHPMMQQHHQPLSSAAPTLASPSAFSVMSTMSTSSSTASVTSTASSKANITKKSAASDVSKVKKKKVTALKKSTSNSSITKKRSSIREPPKKLMETIDHATLIDVKSLPNIFTCKEYKMDVNLEGEQRILLYGDEEQQRKIQSIAKAAAAALDTSPTVVENVDAVHDPFKLKEAGGVPPLPWKLPSVFDGWGTKNVVSVRNSWARVRLPECEMQRVERERDELDRVWRERPMNVNISASDAERAAAAAAAVAKAAPQIENDKTNHVWFNEARAKQDPTLALLSEATELFLKSTIEKAISKARLRQNLDGVRLWHMLQAHSIVPKNNNSNSNDDGKHKMSPAPPALIRLGCDVRRQIALAEGNAAKTCQRMEEAIISRQNDTYLSKNAEKIQDSDTMLLEASSMSDLSKKAPLKMAVQDADANAKRRFAVFAGVDSMEPPLGRVPKKAKVTLQDISVGVVLGNRSQSMTIGSRRKRFRVGLKY